MDTKKLTKEIEELKKEKNSLVEKRNKIGDDFDNSKKYKTLNIERGRLDSKTDRLRNEIEKIDEDIRFNFLINDSRSPSYSTTYGENIKLEVISAIKQTFDFKRLSGSTIESIVRRLINHKQQNNEKRNELKEEINNLSFEEDKIDTKISRLRSELIGALENKIYDLSCSINDKEEELVKIKLDEGKEVKKEELQNPYAKKKVLNEYRENCEQDFIKVFEKLKGVENEKQKK